MYIDLSNAVEGEVYELSFGQDGDDGILSGRDIEFLSPVQFNSRYVLERGIVRIQGDISVGMRAACECCLEETEMTLVIPFSESFDTRSDTDSYTYEGNIIRLEEMINELLQFNLPAKIMCKEDCEGLCPVCGNNRNHHDCQCVADKNNPFSILKSITGGAKDGGTKA